MITTLKEMHRTCIHTSCLSTQDVNNLNKKAETHTSLKEKDYKTPEGQ